MARNLILDYDKIKEYDDMFQRWKEELFPNEEYKYVNEECGSFKNLLANKAKEEGLTPKEVYCFKSNTTPDIIEKIQEKNPDATEENIPSMVFSAVKKEDGSGFDYRVWQEYHVALSLELPIYANSPKTENIIFDPTLFKSPVRENDWKATLNAAEGYVQHGLYNETIGNVDEAQVLAASRANVSGIEPEGAIEPFESKLLRLAAIDKRNNPELFEEKAVQPIKEVDYNQERIKKEIQNKRLK